MSSINAALCSPRTMEAGIHPKSDRSTENILHIIEAEDGTVVHLGITVGAEQHHG